MRVLEKKLDKNETIKNYKKVVWFYDFWSWLTESKAAKHIIELAEIIDNTDVLEVACGTGVVFEQIVKLNPNGKNIVIEKDLEISQNTFPSEIIKARKMA